MEIQNTTFNPGPLKGKIKEVFGSQEAFARADGRSLTAVANIINGHADMNRKTIVKWAQLLKIDLSSPDMNRIFFSVQI